MLREKDLLSKENEKLKHEKETLSKNKELADGQITALTRSLDGLQKELKEKDILVHKMKQLSESQRRELNDCRAEITSLKMHIEGSRSGKGWSNGHSDNAQSHSGNSREETKSSQVQSASPEAELSTASNAADSGNPEEIVQKEVISMEISSGETALSAPSNEAPRSSITKAFDGQVSDIQIPSLNEIGTVGESVILDKHPVSDRSPFFRTENAGSSPVPEKLVPYIDAKVASTHLLPALVTLGSDQNLSVKYASIDAFGSVAQHFRNDMIVDKIRVQMDAFLEDGSLEATIAVVRALMVAVPHTTDKLRDYLLSKIFQFTTSPTPTSDVIRRRERANAFCEAIRALDAADLSPISVRDFLLPSIQNLLKDPDSLDPAHKEALEIVLKERSGGTLEAFSKVMGAHLGIASSVTSLFGEGGLLGKKDGVDAVVELNESPLPSPPPTAEDTRFRRIMRGNFAEMLRGKAKNQDDSAS